MHPTGRQIFAGKSDSTFHNIWDLVIPNWARFCHLFMFRNRRVCFLGFHNQYSEIKSSIGDVPRCRPGSCYFEGKKQLLFWTQFCLKFLYFLEIGGQVTRKYWSVLEACQGADSEAVDRGGGTAVQQSFVISLFSWINVFKSTLYWSMLELGQGADEGAVDQGAGLSCSCQLWTFLNLHMNQSFAGLCWVKM